MRGSSSPATSGLASPASLCCTFSSGSSTCTRGSRSASSGCHGVTDCSSPNRSPVIPRSVTRWRTRTRSSVWPRSTVPARARSLRVVLLELERLYNHTADIGALATDVAFTVPASRAQALREGLVRLQDGLFGTRLLRGTIALGGVTRDLPPESCDALRAHLHGFEKQFDELIRLLVDAGTFTDRVDGAGVLSQQAARDLGIVGMAARASGVDGDLRRDHPTRCLRGASFRRARRRRRRCQGTAHGACAGNRAVVGHSAPGACRAARHTARGGFARPLARQHRRRLGG